MAQAQLDVVSGYPEHEFMVWHKRECCFIEGHCLTFNKNHTKNDGTEVTYFYCNRRTELGCKKSVRAVKGDDDKFTLIGYSGQHHQDCIPNAAYLAVKKVRAAIMARVLADPTEKPTSVYVSEVN